MNKRVFIVHGWDGNPDQHWLPWLKAELEKREFAVQMPAMPETHEPKIDAWVGHLATLVGELNERTYFVGHSIGCQTIMRYLQTQRGKKAGGCVFVAGWFKLENLENADVEQIAKPWMETPIDFAAVLKTTKKITVLLSDNDFYDAVEENAKLFKQHLKAEVQVMHSKGHFTERDGITRLPEALNILLNQANYPAS